MNKYVLSCGLALLVLTSSMALKASAGIVPVPPPTGGGIVPVPPPTGGIVPVPPPTGGGVVPVPPPTGN